MSVEEIHFFNIEADHREVRGEAADINC